MSKKTVQRLFSALLAAIFLCSIPVPAFAAYQAGVGLRGVNSGSIEPQGVRKVQDEMQLVDGAFPILPGVMTLEEAMQKTVAYENMSYTAEQVFRLIGNCYIK